MMNTWFISDNHFWHANILNFKDDNGNFIRPGFADVDEMNQYMIDKWNSVIKPGDKLYHLGDVVMKTGAWAFEFLSELNGRKILIKGNHDRARLNIYARYFDDVRSEIHMKSSEGDMVVFTHRPIRLSGMDSYTFNVHGHIHQNLIEDYRYINMSVEVIDYTPVNWHELDKNILERKRLIERDIIKAEAGVIS